MVDVSKTRAGASPSGCRAGGLEGHQRSKWSYGYDPAGQLETVAYSDDTPPVGYTYDRLGRQDFIRQGFANTAGVREWDYQYSPSTLRLEAEALAFDTNDDGATDFTPTVQRGHDSFGRPSTLALAEGAATHHSQTTRYFGSGRTMGVDVVGLPRVGPSFPVSFFYEFRADIPESWWRVTAPVHVWETAMDLNRPALNRASSRLRAGGGNLSSYAYAVNAIGQRQSVTTGGTAMAAPATTRWGYDALGQLVAEDFGNNQAANPRDRGYAYDLIGNRENSIQGNTNPLAAGNLSYDANPLNQYTSIGAFQPVHDDDGNLTSGKLHSSALSSPTGTPYTASLAWNGENRLVEVKEGTAVKATYQYDFMGRRVRKQVGSVVTWYIYDGYNELGRFTQSGGNAPVIERTFTWGLDISNTPQGAGGVGGLLAVKVHGTTSATYFPTYDANGNISEYLASNGSVAAHFEYDGFGNTVVNTDTNGLFDYRFSTKPLEDVTGLYYYLYRDYDPVTGRWPSRDPIEEQGGVNLFGFVGNDGVNMWDVLGLEKLNDRFVIYDKDGDFLEKPEKSNWIHGFNGDKEAGDLQDVLKQMQERIDPEYCEEGKEPCDCFEKVIIWVHGMNGMIDSEVEYNPISEFTVKEYLNKKSSGDDNLDKQLKALIDIGKIMCKDGKISLRSCEAGTPEMKELMNKLTGVNVEMFDKSVSPIPGFPGGCAQKKGKLK